MIYTALKILFCPAILIIALAVNLAWVLRRVVLDVWGLVLLVLDLPRTLVEDVKIISRIWFKK